MDNLYTIILVLVLSPLLGSLIAGFFGRQLGRQTTHRIIIILMGVSLLLSLFVAKLYLIDGIALLNINAFTWATGGSLFPFSFNIGFLIDPLTAIMLVVVCFVSFFVHVYSIGYMTDDPGYQRFFSYISLFTFSMLMLVTANNFLQLFFGWEAVGLVSYLLIGFWFKKESANQGSLKAFLVNRVGDFGFLLGIAVIFAYTGTLDYQQVFAQSAILV
ncbi:MAG: proton-conducting transporter membrane subunit, partial [Gammaproteobacteria bacterium]